MTCNGTQGRIKIDKNVKIMIPKTNIDKLFIENKKGN